MPRYSNETHFIILHFYDDPESFIFDSSVRLRKDFNETKQGITRVDGINTARECIVMNYEKLQGCRLGFELALDLGLRLKLDFRLEKKSALA